MFAKEQKKYRMVRSFSLILSTGFVAFFLVLQSVLWLTISDIPEKETNRRLREHPIDRSRVDGDELEAWCGDWTPTGNLGNPRFNPQASEALLPGEVPSCPLTRNNLQVGSEYSLSSSFLYCNPPLDAESDSGHRWRDPARLALDLQRSTSYHPEYSIVTPSHNVAEVLQITVPLLCQHTVGFWEVIFVLDQSYDDSLQVIRNVLLSSTCLQNEGLLRARVLVQPTSIFETSSDNLGFTLMDPLAVFAIELQSDMMIQETGWNRDMARPILQYGKIFAVSGRCGAHRYGKYRIGRCAEDFAALDETMKLQDQNQVHVTEIANRGPIIFRTDVLRMLKFFDEVNFHQGEDDRDLFRRALHKGWFVAYRYVHVYSPLNLSPVRETKFNQKTPPEGMFQSHTYSEFRKQLNNKHCDPSIPLTRYVTHDILPQNHPETLPLNPLPEHIDLRDLPLTPLPLHSYYDDKMSVFEMLYS